MCQETLPQNRGYSKRRLYGKYCNSRFKIKDTNGTKTTNH